MSKDAIRLSVRFLTEVKGFGFTEKGRVNVGKQYGQTVMQSFDNLIKSGNDTETLTSLMERYIQDQKPSEAIYNMEDIFKEYGVNPVKSKTKVVEDKENLLESGKFYYHPQLQEAPPPPVVEILPDGSFKASYEEDEFFLEIKDRYTVDDLIDYMYRKISTINKKYRERDKGALKHMLMGAELDAILYAIEEASTSSENVTCAFDIDEYMSQAELILEDRKNTLFMEGLNHVIPRYR